MYISHKTILLFLTLLVQPPIAQADFNPANLIKVNKDNPSQCIEFYIYQGDLYCSNSPSSETTVVDPRIKDYETQNIIFDNRPWQAVWGKQSDTITTVEYIPAGDNIESWHELVTSQFIPGLQNKTTPSLYADAIFKQLQGSGFKPIINKIKDSSNQVIFEFRITEPTNLKQDELQIITQGEKGFYILHYVIKEDDMGQSNRKKWLQNLQKSTIKATNN